MTSAATDSCAALGLFTSSTAGLHCLFCMESVLEYIRVAKVDGMWISPKGCSGKPRISGRQPFHGLPSHDNTCDIGATAPLLQTDWHWTSSSIVPNTVRRVLGYAVSARADLKCSVAVADRPVPSDPLDSFSHCISVGVHYVTADN